MKRRIAVAAGIFAVIAVTAGVAVAATSPSVVTGGTSSRTQSSAVLKGTVNPNDSSSTYYFQWGLTNGYGDTGPTRSAGAGTTAVAVKETAAGLEPGTTYHYRLVATNQYGTSTGSDRTFTTAGHPPPGVATGPATSLSSSGATLTGTVNPSGEATTWYFRWGATTAYGQLTAPQTLPAGASPQSVTASLQGLLNQGTIYHFQLVASHPGSATTYGSDASFLTYPFPRPVAGIGAVTQPRHARLRPFVLTTSGRVAGPSWMPAQYACSGNVTIRFFRGLRQVGFTLAGVGPNCTFSAQTAFQRLPGRGRAPAHLRVVVRFVSTPYLGTNRARIQRITLG
jgi:hypothetical protein